MSNIYQYFRDGTFKEYEHELDPDFGMPDYNKKNNISEIKKFPDTEDSYAIFIVYRVPYSSQEFEYFIELDDWGHSWKIVIIKDMITLFDFINKYSKLLSVLMEEDKMKIIREV